MGRPAISAPSRTGTLVAAGVAAVVAVSLGVGALPGGPLVGPADHFGTGELLGWVGLALATGGFVFGPSDRRPPVYAAGLVGSAALLGAGPLAAAAIGIAGVIGGLRRWPGMLGPRLVTAAVVAWATPGLLAAAASLGGPSLGRIETVSLASVLALWALLAVVTPIAESLATRVVLRPADRVDLGHMLQRRAEPQSVLAALAVVGAVTYDAIGAPALLVVALPAVAARVGFSLHDEGRRAVTQTLAAMTVLPEWVGFVDVGHTARVRETAETVALELGLESRVRRDLVRAAELHELGHLDGGVTDGDRGRVARSGASVLEQAAMRERVVAMVTATDPERLLSSADPVVALAARIVRHCCELDAGARSFDAESAAADVLLALGTG